MENSCILWKKFKKYFKTISSFIIVDIVVQECWTSDSLVNNVNCIVSVYCAIIVFYCSITYSVYCYMLYIGGGTVISGWHCCLTSLGPEFDSLP